VSSPRVEIVNPIRFFSFFGLFLIFLFLAFRSCSEKPNDTKYVEAAKISETEKETLKKANTEELSEFITDIKKDLEKSDQVKDKDLSEAQLAKLEDKNRALRAKAEFNRNRKTANKRAAEKKAAAKRKAAKARQKASVSKKNIIVKSQDGKLSPFSKLKLKQTVESNSKKSFSKIMIYGYYGMDQPKGKAFVKAAQIKNTLIGLGVKRSVPIYMLTEQTRLPNAMGKVIFSQ